MNVHTKTHRTQSSSTIPSPKIHNIEISDKKQNKRLKQNYFINVIAKIFAIINFVAKIILAYYRRNFSRNTLLKPLNFLKVPGKEQRNGFLESRNGFQLGNECQKERADLKGRFNKCSIRDDDTGYLEGLSLQADSWTLDRRITKFKYKGLRDRAISHKRHTVKNKQPISSAKFVLLIDHDHPIFRLLH
ncbi:hypothetical protein RCL_jg7188.t1 [Rhizophagus clarus]|uniref:Transmembrane protein n=1 Tax=Rhizophagus clarus TaxID=94130 RepID=A0A8H3LYG8_9GLOM|nr:hypothetical protein RCL_jg7188.t1 [Rhizophagus clarus]